MTLLPAWRAHVISVWSGPRSSCLLHSAVLLLKVTILTLASLIAIPRPMPCDPPATTASFELRLRPEFRLRAYEDMFERFGMECKLSLSSPECKAKEMMQVERDRRSVFLTPLPRALHKSATCMTVIRFSSHTTVQPYCNSSWFTGSPAL